MNTEPIAFHKIWIEQCEATETIRERFGLQNALDYLIGEKLFHFVAAAEQHPEFAAELPHFLNQIRRTFTAQQIHNYLDDLERAKFTCPIEADEDLDLRTRKPSLPNTRSTTRSSALRNSCASPVSKRCFRLGDTSPFARSLVSPDGYRSTNHSRAEATKSSLPLSKL